MRKPIIFWVILTSLFFFTRPILASEIEYHFKVSAYVLEDSQKTVFGSGSFTIEENKYGKISFTFFKGLEQINILTSGEAQFPATRLLRENEPPLSPGKIFLSSDLYLKASTAEGKSIQIKGILAQLTQAESKGSPLFEYSERELDFVLPEKGTMNLLIGKDKSGKQVFLDISVQTKGELVNKQEEITHHVTFNTEYYLFNQDSKKDELENKGCILGLDVGAETGKVTCSNNKVYKIEGGDSILYLSAYEIKNPTFIDTDKIKFQLEVTHIYAINPVMDRPWPNELKSDKTTVILFNKEISAKIGERTEIEIPQDKESLLPFESKEIIVLINSVKEVKK
ncbi:MAG TPA: hypothetical protein VMT04_07045 [Terriglobales bacterium]|nr:hypothetical protein [Terriglobales bacterium]